MFTTIDKDQLFDLLNQAVYNQIFMGQDKIKGRIPQDTMKFKGAGLLLDKFIEHVNSSLKLLDPKHLENFLGYFESLFNLDLKGVKHEVDKNIAQMSNLDEQELTILYMVLSKLIESIRNQAYLFNGWNEFVSIYQNLGKDFSDEVHNKLNDMAAEGNSEISLIFNLCFLRLLAESFGEKQLASNAKRQITRMIHKLIESMETTES